MMKIELCSTNGISNEKVKFIVPLLASIIDPEPDTLTGKSRPIPPISNCKDWELTITLPSLSIIPRLGYH